VVPKVMGLTALQSYYLAGNPPPISRTWLMVFTCAAGTRHRAQWPPGRRGRRPPQQDAGERQQDHHTEGAASFHPGPLHPVRHQHDLPVSLPSSHNPRA
jgi:hypothetical protein